MSAGRKYSFEEDILEPWEDEKVFTQAFQSIYLIMQHIMLNPCSVMTPIYGTRIAMVIKDQHHPFLPGFAIT